ncbi:uncharacterized protein [Branchiostoma lanceolatum]
MIDAEGYGEEETCKLVRPGVCVPRDQWGTPGPLPPCVNYDVMLPEVTRVNMTLPDTMAELGLNDFLPNIEEIRDAGKIPFRGPTSIPVGGVAAPNWVRVGTAILLIYTATVDGAEQLFAFPSGQFMSLVASDTLEGPIRSLKGGMEGFANTYPDTVAEAMPSLVQDFSDLLDSFNCSTGGPNCNRTLGVDDVTMLGGNWTIVVRPGIEFYLLLCFRFLFVRLCGFRLVVCILLELL